MQLLNKAKENISTCDMLSFLFFSNSLSFIGNRYFSNKSPVMNFFRKQP